MDTVVPNLALAKRLNLYAWIISAAVLGLVVLMRSVKIDLGVDFSFLPPIHATLNALAAVLLMLALWHIKNKRIEAHRRMIYLAFASSALFLVSYVLYHFTTQEILYGDANFDRVLSAEERSAVGSMRTVYLLILLTHIALAALIFPFILLTFIRAYTGQYARHRKMARWVYPIWLYVAITGPVCYLMLKPYYP